MSDCYAADLAREVYYKALEAWRVVLLDPKPSFSVDGQSVSHGEYLRALWDAVEAARKAWIQAAGPVSQVTRGRP
jgi:hypothetical protein